MAVLWPHPLIPLPPATASRTAVLYHYAHAGTTTVVLWPRPWQWPFASPPPPTPTQPHPQRRSLPQPSRGLVCGGGPRFPLLPPEPRTQRHSPSDHCLCSRVHLPRPRRRQSPRLTRGLSLVTATAHPLPLGPRPQRHTPWPPARSRPRRQHPLRPYRGLSAASAPAPPIPRDLVRSDISRGCPRAVTSKGRRPPRLSCGLVSGDGSTAKPSPPTVVPRSPHGCVMRGHVYRADDRHDRRGSRARSSAAAEPTPLRSRGLVCNESPPIHSPWPRAALSVTTRPQRRHPPRPSRGLVCRDGPRQPPLPLNPPGGLVRDDIPAVVPLMRESPPSLKASREVYPAPPTSAVTQARTRQRRPCGRSTGSPGPRPARGASVPSGMSPRPSRGHPSPTVAPP